MNREVRTGRFFSDGPVEAWVEAGVPEPGASICFSYDQNEIEAPGYSLRLEQWATRRPSEHLDIAAAAIRDLPPI